MDMLEPIINTHLELAVEQPHIVDAEDENLLQGGKKRKKVQYKKVVWVPISGDPRKLDKQAQTPPTDFWAWRKYGQKPIKGSPYPRGYYRCSSAKGCSARKQVERSRRDPSMLVVTYTADHNHAMGHNSNKLSKSPEKECSNIQDSLEKEDDIDEDDLSHSHQQAHHILQTNKESPLHLKDIPIMDKYSIATSTSHFSSIIIDSPRTSHYAFEEEDNKQVLSLAPSSWNMPLQETSHFQYVDWQQEGDTKEDVCLSFASGTRFEGDDFFSELGMLPELASIFNKRDNNNIEDRVGPDEIRSINLDPELSILGPPPWSNASPCTLV